MTKVATPKGNGKPGPGSGKDEKNYKVLQQQIQSAIKLIDAALTDYYESNPHFPRRKGSKFFKWTIERPTKESSVVDVFFRENCLPYEISKLDGVQAFFDKKQAPQKAAMMMGGSNGNGIAHALASPETTSSSTLPVVNTYDQVGAPPSGPKDPTP